jgi:hypothetical protein
MVDDLVYCTDSLHLARSKINAALRGLKRAPSKAELEREILNEVAIRTEAAFRDPDAWRFDKAGVLQFAWYCYATPVREVMLERCVHEFCTRDYDAALYLAWAEWFQKMGQALLDRAGKVPNDATSVEVAA